MTNDQRMKFVRSYFTSVRICSEYKALQLHYLARAQGAVDAFEADFMISLVQAQELEAEINQMIKEIE